MSEPARTTTNDTEKGVDVFEINAKEELHNIQGIQVNKKDEQQLLRSLDIRVVGYLSLLYLLSYLDRGNIGNANTAGMSKDIGLSDSQYQLLLTLFYISYIVFEVLIVCWKIFPARYYVPVVVLAWGILSTCSSAVNGFGGLAAIRFLLGVCEAAFGPGVPYYLSRFYKKKELGRRVGFFISMSPLASAFSGALAYGITSNPHLSIQNWRILFLVEGLPTIVAAVGAYFMIPSSPTDCNFLNDSQKETLMVRSVQQNGDVDITHKLKLRDITSSILDIKNIIMAVMFFSINVSFSALPVFLPSILHGMGYTSVHAQGLSAPPYVITFLIILVTTWLSDKYMERGLAIMIHSAVGIAGYLILALSHSTPVRYFAVYLVCVGIFPCVPVLLCWVNNLHASDGHKNIGMIILQIGGQCGPVLGTRLFPARQGPHYTEGMWIGFGFTCAIFLLAASLRTYLKFLNRKLDKEQGFTVNIRNYEEVPSEHDANFRYIA